jgi:curved DNA-binding protein CbpA
LHYFLFLRANEKLLRPTWTKDKNEGDEFFSEMFKQINEANEVLSSPARRKEYDKRINSENSSPKQSYQSNTNSYKTYNTNQEQKQTLRKKLEIYLKRKDDEYIFKCAYENSQFIPKPTYFTATKFLGCLALVLVVFAFNFKSSSQTPTEPTQSEVEKKPEPAYEYYSPESTQTQTNSEEEPVVEEEQVDIIEPETQQQETTGQETVNENQQIQQPDSSDTVQQTIEEEPKKKKKRWRLFGRKKGDDQ